MEYIVPMYESERGWGAKIDGYAGPFPSYEAASQFVDDYNKTNNNLPVAPDWYIKALEPRQRAGEACEYKTDVEGREYGHKRSEL